MKVLFVHQNFPAQFGRLASWLVAKGHQVVFLTGRKDISILGVYKAVFQESRVISKETHHYLRSIEKAVLQGQAALRTAAILKQQGFVPDVIYGHSGFGAPLFLKEVYPGIPFLGYFEWYYHAHGADADFGEKNGISVNDACRVQTRNMSVLPDLVECAGGVTPTYWQHRQLPIEFANKVSVLHDGIDTELFSPLPQDEREEGLYLPSCNLRVPAGKEIITYVGRGMDPYRGFPEFMEAVSALQKHRPNCHVVVVGADRVAYGMPHPSGKSYKKLALEKHEFDHSRLHFTGPLSYSEYRQVLQHSSVHVYLTYPFVLSWSFLEAMACGCAIVASQTPPVEEVMQHGQEGILVPFFEVNQLVSAIMEALDNKEMRKLMGQAARKRIVECYAAERLLPIQESLLEKISQWAF